MTDHPPLCICHACMQAEITRWRKGVEDANRISQRFEAENVKLRAALREIVADCDGGFIPCDRCGDEVWLKDCDMRYTARAALAAPPLAKEEP